MERLVLSGIHLENFKACKDVQVRLAPLTVLAGLNSSGKSTLLQAVALLKQSYAVTGSISLHLSGHLVQLGKFGDILSEGAEGDAISITVVEGNTASSWAFRGAPEANQLDFEVAPSNLPSFIHSVQFQFLQADRIVPRTLYPQAPQHARDAGFLGSHGEYTVDILSVEATRPVSKARIFPRQGSGHAEDLLGKVSPTEGLLDQASAWLQYLSPGTRLRATAIAGTDEVLLQFGYVGRLRDSASNLYRPTNVGFGLTYSLPILVACLAARRGALLLLENPEAHLHPQGQAALGELLARCANDGVQIIVETHSDHLLNGIRLAVKEGRCPSGAVVLHFFSRQTESGEAFVQSPTLLENGRLSNWPSGFFDQWDKDVTSLLD